MAEDKGTVAHDVVYVGVAVDVEDARALAATHEHRISAHGAERPDRAVDPPGKTMCRPFHQTSGTIHRERCPGVYALAATTQSCPTPFRNFAYVLYLNRYPRLVITVTPVNNRTRSPQRVTSSLTRVSELGQLVFPIRQYRPTYSSGPQSHLSHPRGLPSRRFAVRQKRIPHQRPYNPQQFPPNVGEHVQDHGEGEAGKEQYPAPAR